jgi:hypothetical protein
MVFSSFDHFSLSRDNQQLSPHSGKAMIVFACLFILGIASTSGPLSRYSVPNYTHLIIVPLLWYFSKLQIGAGFSSGVLHPIHSW